MDRRLLITSLVEVGHDLFGHRQAADQTSIFYAILLQLESSCGGAQPIQAISIDCLLTPAENGWVAI